MRKLIGDLAYATADGVGLNWLSRRARQQDVIVLMYHGLAPDDSPVDAWTLVRQSDFRMQMEYLRRHCEVLSIEQLSRDEHSWRKAGGKRKVLITFDDGYRSNFTLAHPILCDLRLPATIFVATGFVGTRNLFWYDKVIHAVQSSRCAELDLRAHDLGVFRLSTGDPAERWADIQMLLTAIKTRGFEGQQSLATAIGAKLGAVPGDDELFAPLQAADIVAMQRDGVISFGSHTHRHEILTQATLGQARETIERSLAELHALLGAPCRTFSYPNGDFNPQLMDLLERMGLRFAFTTHQAFWSRKDHPLAIPRVGIGGYDSIGRFAAIVSGLALAH